MLTIAPEYSEDAMVVLPLGAILDWTMGTPAGFAAFRDRRINAMLKKILSVWCEFLSSVDSRYVINDSPSGWKGEAAKRAIGIEQYQHDPACKIDRKIRPGYHVAKGEELGYFQFGGSTHCLVFRPGAIADFSLTAIPQPHDPRPALVRVRSRLATAAPR